MKRLALLVLVAAAFAPAAQATAFDHVTIRNVSIQGVTYDVTFRDGSIDSVYAPDAPFSFSTYEEAGLAVDAILARPEFQALYTPLLAGLLVPIGHHDRGADLVYFYDFTDQLGFLTLPDSSFDLSHFSDGTGETFATFSTPAAVPEPAAWVMMIGGFGLIGTALRSQHRTKISFGWNLSREMSTFGRCQMDAKRFEASS